MSDNNQVTRRGLFLSNDFEKIARCTHQVRENNTVDRLQQRA